MSLSAATGQVIAAEIEKIETKYQTDVDEMSEGFRESLFKKLRRFSTVTGQKFDWSGKKLM
jgi:hypothetical protein